MQCIIIGFLKKIAMSLQSSAKNFIIRDENVDYCLHTAVAHRSTGRKTSLHRSGGVHEQACPYLRWQQHMLGDLKCFHIFLGRLALLGSHSTWYCRSLYTSKHRWCYILFIIHGISSFKLLFWKEPIAEIAFASENNSSVQWKGKNKSYSINQIKSQYNIISSRYTYSNIILKVLPSVYLLPLL